MGGGGGGAIGATSPDGLLADIRQGGGGGGADKTEKTRISILKVNRLITYILFARKMSRNEISRSNIL